jgi:hypothetical protein
VIGDSHEPYGEIVLLGIWCSVWVTLLAETSICLTEASQIKRIPATTLFGD